MLAAALYVSVPRSVNLSYAGATCVSRLTLLPEYHRSYHTAFAVTFQDSVRLGDVALWSSAMCVTPTQEPQPGTSHVQAGFMGSELFALSLQVAVGLPPVARAASFDTPVPVTKPLVVQLSETDAIYDYRLAVDGKKAKCVSHEKGVVCDVPSLDLAQGKTYPVTVLRSFQQRRETPVYRDELTVVTQVQLVKSSVVKDQAVYDVPEQLTLEFNKPLVAADVTLKNKEGDQVSGVSVQIAADRVVLQLAEPLARKMSYELVVQSVEATDGATLDSAAYIPFTVSGGPQVAHQSLSGAGAPPTGSVILTLDQELHAEQSLGDFVSVTGVSAVVTGGGKQIRVQYTAGKCADITITIKKGLTNTHGVPQTDDWRTSLRTACYTVQTIGVSKQGRAIQAYSFGNGGSTVLFTGAIHGSEASSSLILHDLIRHLDANPREIPAHHQVVIVPTVNPDGLARGSRNNANNVNLNRNFDTNDWKQDIKDTNGMVPGGGGAQPMSEPETKAIAALSAQLRPRLVLSFHAVGSVAIGNQAGDSARLAGIYAGSVGYGNGTGSSGEIFTYEITGTYDDWLAQKLGVPSIVVELGSYHYRNFGHHRAVMMRMIAS